MGTAWGAIGLTIFYTLWGLGNIIIYPFSTSLLHWSRMISRILNVYGFLIYFFCFYIYNQNMKGLLLGLGFAGLAYDWLLVEKLKDRLWNDISLIEKNNREKDFVIGKIMG